jgi:hypothetical protein
MGTKVDGNNTVYIGPFAPQVSVMKESKSQIWTGVNKTDYMG